MNSETRWFGMLTRRPCWVPTLRGMFLIGLGLLVGILTFVWRVHPFLSMHAPVAATVMVVEGWASDEAIVEALKEFKRGSYERLYVTGGPLEAGGPLSEHRSYAELGAKVLVKMGAAPEKVTAVPAPRVKVDRTYASAVALKEWFQIKNAMPRAMNVVTVGAHARRTRLMFRAAFGAETEVGVYRVLESDYDGSRWWVSSRGVRDVLNECIAYAYAGLLFRPDR